MGERLRRGGYTRESARFTSRDGVVLAADLFLPAGASRTSFDDDDAPYSLANRSNVGVSFAQCLHHSAP